MFLSSLDVITINLCKSKPLSFCLHRHVVPSHSSPVHAHIILSAICYSVDFFFHYYFQLLVCSTVSPSFSFCSNNFLISLRTCTSCQSAWRLTPSGCGGTGGWRSPGCVRSEPRCESEPGHDWLCWGWWRFACCAHHYEGLSAHGPCMQKTPALLQAKATC